MNEDTNGITQHEVPPLGPPARVPTGGGGGIIQLSNQAFWDVDMNKLDYDKQADYVIRKVFEHGNWNDILETSVFYGMEKVRDVLINSKYLRENTLYFASLFLGTPKSQFKCYTTKQYHPAH